MGRAVRPLLPSDNLPSPTPEHLLKPRLVYVGKLLGMDIYADTSRQNNPEQKHSMLINLLRQQFYPPPKEDDNGNA